MAAHLQFGWRMPDFPEDWLDDRQEQALRFRNQILQFMDVIHGHLDMAWAGDHLFPWPADMAQSMDTLEPWTLLTYLMGIYPQMKFCPSVLNQAFRPPSLVAKMAAVLQLLSGGRLILGIGAGWKENEQRAYGYDFPSDKIRLDQLEEAVQVIRKMWAEDSPTFHGTYYSIENAYCFPRPDPVPPLLIGGFGPKRTLKIVAKYADLCNINDESPDFCRDRLAILRDHCESVGRDYDAITKTYICDCVAVAPTHEAAQAMQDSSFFAPYRPIAGTPDEVAREIACYAELGFSTFILRFADYPETDGVKLFIEEVLPRFQ
jgi:alkanesulfonate monooxygenase SsuD/methylene tetrahydromethanopterin reductase-like flavin-dependent oxidoreductase (luciferase family)